MFIVMSSFIRPRVVQTLSFCETESKNIEDADLWILIHFHFDSLNIDF